MIVLWHTGFGVGLAPCNLACNVGLPPCNLACNVGVAPCNLACNVGLAPAILQTACNDSTVDRITASVVTSFGRLRHLARRTHVFVAIKSTAIFWGSVPIATLQLATPPVPVWGISDGYVALHYNSTTSIIRTPLGPFLVSSDVPQFGIRQR